MIKRYILGLIAALILTAFFCQSSLAKEDTAQISLQKTAVSKQNVQLYKIKKGDVISAIIRKLPEITDDDIPDNYRIIKELNPDIENLNKLYVGQIIKLPGKSIHTDSSDASESANKQDYKIKKGDCLITIIYRELKIKTNTIQALKLIKSMNPRISNVNKIYAGQVIKLPGNIGQALTPDGTKNVEQPAENKPAAEKIPEVKEVKIMRKEAKLALIKHVLTQMKASVLSSGNYYIPISKSGQITIDCKKIPVIEFDNKTTVFLDWENHLSNNLNKMIHDNWKNFAIVKVDKKDDVITILKKIFSATKTYNIIKEIPIKTGTQPPVEVLVDWLIVKTDSKQGSNFIQGLRFVPENNSLLPKAIKNYTKQNGLIITEIDKETGLADKPEEIYSLPPMPVFPSTSAKDFSYALLTHLGFNASKDADIKVFNMGKDGFNLSIKADVLIKNDDKKYIVYSSSIPLQFINILKGEGYNLIAVSDSDSPKVMMEKILPNLGIPSAFGHFTFSGLDKNQAAYTFGFTAMKIKTDKDLYVIDFPLDDGLRALIGESWQAGVARY